MNKKLKSIPKFRSEAEERRFWRLDEFGYETSPLEKMAYGAEVSFKRSSAIFAAEGFVAEVGASSIVAAGLTGASWSTNNVVR